MRLHDPAFKAGQVGLGLDGAPLAENGILLKRKFTY